MTTLKDKETMMFQHDYDIGTKVIKTEDVKGAILELKDTFCRCKKDNMPVNCKCISCAVIGEIMGDFEK